MILWLQSFNTPEKTVYTVAQINTYPLPIYAVQVVTTLVWAWWSDAAQLRWPPIVFAGIWCLITNVVLAATPLYTNIARRWVFYYFTLALGGLSGIILTWANELNGHDNEKRSFVIACCNTFAYVVQAWLPIVIFPQVEQPRVFKGTVATACINGSMVIMAFVVRYLSRRDARRAREKAALAANGVLETDVDADADAKVRVDAELVAVERI